MAENEPDLRKICQELATAARRMMNNSSGGWAERADVDAAIAKWDGYVQYVARVDGQ